MRHTNASPYCAVPAVSKPAACSAASASPDCPGAQPRSMLPWKCEKSTITVTPDVAVHADAGAAPARAAGAAIARIAIAAPMAAMRQRARAHGHLVIGLARQPTINTASAEHDRRGRRRDRQLLAGHRRHRLHGCEHVRGGAPGKMNAPKSGLVQPSW